MRSEAEFLAQILDDAPQGVWVVDGVGWISLVNPAAVAALGYDHAAELLGRPSHDTLHYKRPDGSPSPLEACPISRSVRSRVAGHGEDEWFVRRDGSMFPVDWWCAPLSTSRGLGSVLMFDDVSQRRVVEQATRERAVAEIRAAASQAAQRRILEGVATARRQIAHDLTGGALRRLSGVLADLRHAREALATDPEGARRRLAAAVEQTQRAVDELRELAAGVHPPLLAHRGLLAALDELAHRTGLPVTVTGSLPGRLPEVVETSAYSFVSEALTDAVGYAGATGAAVRVAVGIGVDDAVLWVEVSSDGAAGADAVGPAKPADRIDALGGRVVRRTRSAGGVVVRAEIPAEP